MAYKYHMKKDQSGPGLCTASIEDCPNGEFGHYSEPGQVFVAYELAVQNGEVPGLSTIISHTRNEIIEDRAISKDINGENLAGYVRNLNMSDQSEFRKYSTHPDPYVRMEALKSLNNKEQLADSIEAENDIEVIMEMASNPQLSEDDFIALKKRASRLRANGDQKRIILNARRAGLNKFSENETSASSSSDSKTQKETKPLPKTNHREAEEINVVNYLKDFNGYKFDAQKLTESLAKEKRGLNPKLQEILNTGNLHVMKSPQATYMPAEFRHIPSFVRFETKTPVASEDQRNSSEVMKDVLEKSIKEMGGKARGRYTATVDDKGCMTYTYHLMSPAMATEVSNRFVNQSA